MDVPLPFKSLPQNANDANDSDSKSTHSENYSTQQDVEKGLSAEDLQHRKYVFEKNLKLKLCDL